MPSLRTYHAKRNFKLTKEPRGHVVRGKSHRFVIQRHDATRLHYDLRLELGGVYRSWAVTKVPSLDPAVKRLAVEVEDHPLDYGTFEGTIPQGQYGGGTVQLWDRGIWRPQSERPPQKDLAAGHLKFELDGERMHGGWALVRLRDREARPGQRVRHNWLLIKEKDEAAQPGEPDALLAADTSVKTGRTLEEIASRSRKTWNSSRGETKKAVRIAPALVKKKETRKTQALGRPAHMLDFVEPELCKVVETPPGQTGWVHEVKFDGYRMQLRVEKGRARLKTRRGLDWTEKFPEIAKDGAKLPDCIIDGEIVAMDKNGISNFAALQEAISEAKTERLVFFVFDLPFAQGRDLRGETLSARKDALEKFLQRHARASHRLRFVGHLRSQGKAVLEAACRLGLEGVVSKRLTSPYRSGRGGDWVKAKCRGGQEVVVGGWWGDAKKLRSLMMGVYQGREFHFIGAVGTGFNAENSPKLLRELKKREQKQSPFTGPNKPPRSSEIHWVKPDLVAEVEFANFTASGIMRQASFKGLREDKTARSVVREPAPQAKWRKR